MTGSPNEEGRAYRYGGDYNPEQWPEEVWLEDARLMREAGVNLVTLGVFSWAKLEPREGEYDFGWLDRVLGVLHEHGIAVDLATATASPPAWAAIAYADLSAVDERGARYWYGSRQHYAPSSPNYRRLAGNLATELGRRYVTHPAIELWHVNNEYGCHVALDYSASAEVAFRGWLQGRYHSIDALNDAWGTAFWSQGYGSFDEVVPPRFAPYSHNPGQMLDFRRFSSDALLDCFRLERDALRAVGVTQPITTNFIGFLKHLDYRTWAPEVDVVSDDCYPDPADPDAFRHAAFERDVIRGLADGGPWMLMEQASSAVNWRPRNAVKRPGQMAALSMQAVARGADAVMFFQWRQSTAGAERYHSAMLPHAGTGTRTWKEVVALGDRLAALPALPSAEPARVAVVFDWESWWTVEGTDHPGTLDYQSLVAQWHLALQDLHVGCDVVGQTADLAPYEVVIAPALHLLQPSAAAALTAFADGGGTLVMTSFTDVVDQYDRLRPGGYFTQMRELFGIEVLEHSGSDDATVQLVGSVEGLSGGVLEDVQPREAEVMASFADGPFPSGAAVTRRATAGGGSAVYVAAQVPRVTARAILEGVLGAEVVDPERRELPEWVEVVDRGPATFVINHGDAVAIKLGGRSLDLAPQQVEVLGI
jgi:beta-galactosidase